MSKFEIMALVAIRAEMNDKYYKLLLTVFNRHPELVIKMTWKNMNKSSWNSISNTYRMTWKKYWKRLPTIQFGGEKK